MDTPYDQFVGRVTVRHEQFPFELWMHGGVIFAQNDHPYQRREPVTLCRISAGRWEWGMIVDDVSQSWYGKRWFRNETVIARLERGVKQLIEAAEGRYEPGV